MRKFSFFILLIFTVTNSLAQDDTGKNPNVELPDFVITGSDISSIQKGKKIETEFIPLLDKTFFEPTYSPEDLKLHELSDPVRNLFNINDSSQYFVGKLEAKAGNYTLPSVSLSLSNPFNNGISQFTFAGKNRRAFIENSEQYKVNGGVDIFYQLESESPIFNGTKFQFHGDYGRASYQLYAANDPYIKRDLNKGKIILNMENLLEEKFNYKIGMTDDIHSLQDNIFSENFLDFNAMFRFNPSELNFGVNTSYKVQFLKNDIVQRSTKGFFSVKPFVGYRLNNHTKFSIGLNYFNIANFKKVYPYLFIGSKINDRISILAEYSPQVIVAGSGFFLDRNPYFYIHNFVNLAYEKKSSINISAKYEFDKYYEINGGIKYYSSDEAPYFASSALDGRFNIHHISAKSYSGYINLLFHLGPYGFFYGTIELSQTKTKDGLILPYHPAINSFLTYGYNFDMGLKLQLTLEYQSMKYTDIVNSNSLNPFVNLSMNLTYTISQEFNLTFDLNNMLNRKDYQWFNYQESQLDFSAGIVYRW